MLFSSAISGFFLLAASVAAYPRQVVRAAQASNPPLEITNLVINDVDTGNTTLTFDARNPEPLSNATATCTASWSHQNKDFPGDSDRVRCGNTTFAWYIEKYNDVKNFTITLQQVFKDPEVGDPPYDRVTVFGKGLVNSTVVAYEGVGGKVVGTQIKGKTISAPIYATVA